MPLLLVNVFCSFFMTPVSAIYTATESASVFIKIIPTNLFQSLPKWRQILFKFLYNDRWRYSFYLGAIGQHIVLVTFAMKCIGRNAPLGKLALVHGLTIGLSALSYLFLSIMLWLADRSIRDLCQFYLDSPHQKLMNFTEHEQLRQRFQLSRRQLQTSASMCLVAFVVSEFQSIFALPVMIVPAYRIMPYTFVFFPSLAVDT